MLIPCRINTITRVRELRAMYAVYQHKDVNGTIQYIGYTPLADLFSLDDALSNTEWQNFYSKNDEFLEIEVLSLTTDEQEAIRESGRLIMEYRPPCNVKGMHINTKYQDVVCIETGERFRNARACAHAHNLTYSHLYNHLRGKPGHKTVKGRTYNYAIPEGYMRK